MNYTAENSLITALFYNDPSGGTATDETTGLVDAEDFHDAGCRSVFSAALMLRSKGLPVDLSGTLEEMVKGGLGHSEALAWLVDSTAGSPVDSQGFIARYCAKIKEAARARQLTISIGLAGERLESGHSIEQVKTELVSEIERIEEEKSLSSDRPIGDVVMPTLTAMADRIMGDDSKRGMQTGISYLDTATKGLKPGELWIVGAMPGRGKTAFALQVAMNMVNDGYPVYFASMEMSSSAILQRLLKMKFGSRMVENPTPEEWRQIIEYGAEIKALPLNINESSSLGASEIAQHARVQIARNKVRLIIVDYLQIVRGPGRDRRERTGDAANILRSLAKDSGVPVLALSQLRRPDSLNDRPSMIELKESGDLEAHAHVVALLHIPINEDGTFTGEEEIIIGKNREGPTGSVPVWFDKSKVQFRERTK